MNEIKSKLGDHYKEITSREDTGIKIAIDIISNPVLREALNPDLLKRACKIGTNLINDGKIDLEFVTNTYVTHLVCIHTSDRWIVEGRGDENKLMKLISHTYGHAGNITGVIYKNIFDRSWLKKGLDHYEISLEIAQLLQDKKYIPDACDRIAMNLKWLSDISNNDSLAKRSVMYGLESIGLYGELNNQQSYDIAVRRTLKTAQELYEKTGDNYCDRVIRELESKE